jgi:hypothetical protein
MAPRGTVVINVGLAKAICGSSTFGLIAAGVRSRNTIGRAGFFFACDTIAREPIGREPTGCDSVTIGAGSTNAGLGCRFLAKLGKRAQHKRTGHKPADYHYGNSPGDTRCCSTERGEGFCTGGETYSQACSQGRTARGCGLRRAGSE